MEINKLHENFDAVELKMAELLDKYTTLKYDLDTLKQERKDLKATIEKQKETIKNFHNKPKLGSIVIPIATDAQDAEALRQRIDEFVKEIENCIAYLSE
jgi:predicted  nucleic acid-binding Zn-ribbon protein